MKYFFVVVIVALIAVAFMMLSLAITRIRKGRDLQSDVGNNDDMKRLGLTCTSKAFMKEERALRGGAENKHSSCDDGCSSCSTPTINNS